MSLRIGPISVTKGGREGQHFALIDLWRLPYGGTVSIPVYVLVGRREGPVLALISGQHGNELRPIEVLRQFLAHDPTTDFSGVIVVVPVANPLAVADGTRNTVIDGTNGNGGNLNRLWPGKEEGFVTERIASWLWENVITQAEYVIDFHDGTERIGIYYSYTVGEPTTRVQSESNRIAQAFGQEVLMRDPALHGTLSSEARAAGIVTMGCEVGDFYGIRRERTPAGEPIRTYLEVGLTGIDNAMRAIGMIEGEVEPPRYQVVVGPETGIGPAAGGLLQPELSSRHIGTLIEKGAILGRILDPYSFKEIDILAAPYDETILLAAPSIEPFAMTFPGGGDFGYYVADWGSREWIQEMEGLSDVE